MIAAASPATSAKRTGALYKFQKRKSSPLLAVVLPTCPNKLACGFQKILSKHKTTLFKLPNPSLCIAEVFQSGKGGQNWTVLSWVLDGVALSLRTPRGRVQSTTSAEKQLEIGFYITLELNMKALKYEENIQDGPLDSGTIVYGETITTKNLKICYSTEDI